MKKRRMSKRAAIAAVVAAFVLVFTLSACNSSTPDSSVSSDTSLQSEASQSDASQPEVSGDTSAQSETSQPAVSSSASAEQGISQSAGSTGTYSLTAPKTDGGISVEKAIESRRSRRNFTDTAVSMEQLSQLLWAAYGITSPNGLRTAPSAGALYPLEVYAVIGNVSGVEPGVYRYVAQNNQIVRVVKGDVRSALSQAALGQTMVAQAPMSIFYSAVFERSTSRYGERGITYTYIEVGHSAQNVYLQAESLGLGTCAIGAFTDNQVTALLGLPSNEVPVYLMPVGHFSS